MAKVARLARVKVHATDGFTVLCWSKDALQFSFDRAKVTCKRCKLVMKGRQLSYFDRRHQNDKSV